MLQISEWLPNPAGIDAKGEWVELQNSGTGTINTAGWSLKNEKGARFNLSSRIVSPGEFYVIRKPELSLALRNTNGGLSLFDSAGRLVETEKFLGVAPEGKSFGLVQKQAGSLADRGNNINEANRAVRGLSWMEPTPGGVNKETSFSLAGFSPPSLNPPSATNIPFLPLIFFPILITSFVFYTVKQDEGLYQLVFKRNGKDRKDEAATFVLKEEGEPSDDFGPGR
jgi:hypothetical protein